MDFIEGLPLSNGYIVIMVIVNQLTKYVQFVALKHASIAMTITKPIVPNVVL